MTRTQWPTPAQIGAYLTAHGWRFARPMKHPGAVYVYHRPADSGNDIELFVPEFDPCADPVEDFATSVLAVVETIRALEQSTEEVIFAEMLAIDVTPAPRTPPAAVK
jgi:hypothetical protein